MCFVGGVVTKTFGVLAADSAAYDTSLGKTTFENPKMFVTQKMGYAVTFIGTMAYFMEMPDEIWGLPFAEACKRMSEWFFGRRELVGQRLAEAIADEDENKPNFCCLLMGMHKGYPTLAQFNSFSDFVPKYLWTKDSPAFSTIYFGDDAKRNDLFKSATEYMELKAKEHADLTPGLAAEVLTRGIYRKADQEQKQYGKKYAGGVVNCLLVTPHGTRALSGYSVIGG